MNKVSFPNIVTQIQPVERKKLEYFPYVQNVTTIVEPVIDYSISYSNVKKYPKTLKEAYDVLSMISDDKSSKARQVYNIDELRLIAKNLNLSASGKKSDLVARIHSAVTSYMSESEPNQL